MSDDSAPVPVRKLANTNDARDLRDAFLSVFNKLPDFYVRVPGRVNLIGEHIDYCGYSVCPMALEQHIALAVSVESDNILSLHNIDGKFADFSCQMENFEISIGEGFPTWNQYFLCGVKGIIDILEKRGLVKGMKVVVKGNVPQSAGLSSSSALVSAAALATAHANNFSMSKEKIASVCAECERYIGTQGGGMDQAIAFLANEGCAKLIDFNPLRSTDVLLPTGTVFVIAHSLTNLNKAATGDFNCRVVECRLAAQIIANKRGLEWREIKRLGDLQKALNIELIELVRLTEEILHELPYTKHEVVQELKTTSDMLDDVSLTQNTRHLETFKLKQRALHVFQEAQRVSDFHELCKKSEGTDTLRNLGRLMSQSHDSLSSLYECSHPQLDKLVEIAKKYSFGARLTGAGWGGCAVALLTDDMLLTFMEKMKEEFYKPLGILDGLEGLLFSTSPKGGACIYVPN